MQTAVVYDHRGRSVDEGPIEIRVTVGGKVFYLNTGIKVLRCNFVGSTIVNQSDCVELNERLSIIYNKVQEELNRYIADGVFPDLSAIRKKIKTFQNPTADNGRHELIDFIDKMMSVMNLTEGTMKHYVTLKTRLVEFGEMSNWSDLTAENLYKFDAWLHTITKNLSNADKLQTEKPRYISDAAVWNYHKTLKALLNRAVRLDKIPFNPYDRLRGEFKCGDIPNLDYLTEEEMQAIESLHPVPGTQMAVTRDLFVFQMHTGLSYADTQAFDIKNYHKVNGRLCTVGKRVKTGVQYVIQLSDECVSILERYGWSLPSIGNAKYNKCLKTLGVAAGIEKRLHSHIARHSFATMMTANGAAIQNVARMLGHADIKQTQRYARVLPESVYAEFDSVQKKKKQ